MKTIVLLAICLSVSAMHKSQWCFKSIRFLEEWTYSDTIHIRGLIERRMQRLGDGTFEEGRLEASIEFNMSTNEYSGNLINQNYMPQEPETKALSAAKAQEYFEKFRKAHKNKKESDTLIECIKRFSHEEGSVALCPEGQMDGLLGPAVIDATDTNDDQKEN